MDSNERESLGSRPLLEAVLDEQSLRWTRGERPGAEEYFDRFPVLRENLEAALDVVYQEFILRREFGESPRAEDFVRRFPFLANPLIAQLATHEAMQSAMASTGLPTDPDLGPLANGASTSTDTGEFGSVDHGSFGSFPGYQVLGIIGQGGMGIVYKTRNTRLNRVEALKTITEVEPATPNQPTRLLGEARAAARLKHPNIITVYEIGEHQGRPYFAQEFIDGGDLKRLLANKPMTARQSAELVEILARAMHAAHTAGIVHRDLKPSNILLTIDGVPKVADFGLAKLLGGDSGRTQSGQVVGTPSYMAPEQAKGRSRDVGPVADVYALGAILYEALTGRPPFLGDSQLETLRLVTSTEPVFPRQLRPGIPRDLEAICLKCLEKEPQRRYESAEALAEELRRFLANRSIKTRPVGAFGRTLRWSRRNPWVSGLSVAVVAILVGGTVVSTILMMRAIQAERSARSAARIAKKERDQAEEQARITKAVNEFLNEDLLAQASVYGQSKLRVPPDPDLKVRTTLDRAAEQIGRRFAGQSLVEASIRQTIGRAYLELGLYPQARPHLERALELWRGARGNQDPDTLVAMIGLGSLHFADSRLAEAESYFVPALEGLLIARGPEHPDTLTAKKALTELYLNQGAKLVEAESLASHVREVLLRSRGEKDLKTLDATNMLGLVLQAVGKSEQAEQTFKKVIDELQSERAGDHPLTLLAKHNLAQFYYEQRRKIDAERLWEEVLDRQRKVLGSTHPHTLLTMTRLAHLFLEKEDLNKPERLFTEAVQGCRAALDRNHETVMGALGGLAAVYSMKQYDVLLIPSTQFASDIPREGKSLIVVTTWNQSLHFRVFDCDGETIVDINEKSLADKVPQIQDLRRQLEQLGHPAHELSKSEKEQLASAVTSIFDHIPKGPALGKLGPVLIEARDIVRKRYGPNDELTAEGNQSVGLFFVVQYDYAQAEPCFRDCLTFWVDNAPDRKERFLNELRLGVCLLAKRSFAEAKALLISGFNGMKPCEENAIPANMADLAHVIKSVQGLREPSGQLFNDASLARLRSDPIFETILVELVFAEPFS